MSDVRPFLSTIPSTSAPRSLGSALTAVPTAPATSPWSPRGAEPAPVAAPAIDTKAIEDAARDKGREEGLAEVAELRARLASAIAAFTSARDALKEPAIDKIAAAAAAVVSAWTETATPAELYAPIVRAWLAKSAGPATAHVTPAHVDELKELAGDAPLTIVADPSMRAGDLRLSSSTLELCHQWDHKLADLREAIAAALEKA
ncbi:MAG: hypothetical protein HOV81_05230 [Kofleriaceae bacterium]|nr:hypothetical protein [Kofleriaceae bacterium]